ncbi:Casein kinase I isoform gamma-3 [Halotydeus destructor]|nr:Casein kinase I isoform gamma-3 [Halotydeus destructor]
MADLPKFVGAKEEFEILHRIDKGAFSKIYLGISKVTKKNVVLKLETTEQKYQLLKKEYDLLKEMNGKRGIPLIFEFCAASGDRKFNVMSMQLLGPNVEKLFKACKKKFTLKTTVQIAVQMFNLIEYIHSKRIIYCDVKPENFVIADPAIRANNDGYAKNLLYVIDFGLSKKFVDQNGEHIKPQSGTSVFSAARYASINAHLHKTLSRRDDLEVLGYVWVYFLHGKLPWMNITSKDTPSKEVWRIIGERKRSTPIEVLCNECPEEFASYLRYVRNMGFEDTPDYEYIRGLLTEMYDRAMCDNEYDWGDIGIS